MGGEEQREGAAQADGARVGALQRAIQKTLRDPRDQNRFKGRPEMRGRLKQLLA